MSDVSSVTFLATANLRGNLALLPRLFSLIQQERHAAAGLVLLLDLGDTCALEAWICRETTGRAPLIVLDGMGYDAALVGGPEDVSIPPEPLKRLAQQVQLKIMLWHRVTTLTRRDITLAVASGKAALPAGEPGIYVDRASEALPAPGDRAITLGDVPAGMLARVDVAWPAWTVQAARLIPLPDDMPPDPTIQAVVEFVENEAHTYAQQGGPP